MLRARLAAAVLAVATALAFPARAGTSAADRDAARTLAGKGYELLEAGQYERAIELFQQAEGHFHAPPHWLYIARAQVKLGKLLEAERSYQHILDEKLAPDAPAPFKDAAVSARAELGEVSAIVPSLTLVLVGDAPAGTKVTIDGAPVAPGALGQPLREDPGAHVIKVEAPGRPVVERTVALKLGGGEPARVVLPIPRSAASWIVPAAITFSVGAVGLGVGTAAAILSTRATDANRSPLRITEIAGFAAGGAGVLAGILIVALRPKAPAAALAPLPHLRVGIGPGSLMLSGEF